MHVEKAVYIKRHEAMNAIRKLPAEGFSVDHEILVSGDKVFKALESVPAENVSPIDESEWFQICNVTSWQFTDEHYQCKRCGNRESRRKSYCSGCGAKMKNSELEEILEDYKCDI